MPYQELRGSLLVTREPGTGRATHRLRVPEDKASWRTALRQLTHDGADLHAVLYSLAKGECLVVRLPDGSETVTVPTPEVRRASAVDLLHLLHGKPVAQTEVAKAELEAVNVRQLAAMPDEELIKIALGETVDVVPLPPPSEPSE